MSLMSMTGRGTGAAANRLVRVEAELSSVNRKQLDVNVGLPRFLLSFESRMQERVQRVISRGRLSGEIRVTWTESAQATGVRVNEGLARAQVAALRATAKKMGLPDDLKASTLMALPEVVGFERDAADIEALWPVVQKALDTALTRLHAMRKKEGTALARDLRARLKGLEVLARKIGVHAPAVAETYRRNLLKRIGTALPGAELAGDERVLKEIALFADRADITEERVRLDSHLKQVDGLLKTGGVIGRTLDFLVQEMGREINTIGSKANDGEITRQVIAFKTELERIREQVQNIE